MRHGGGTWLADAHKHKAAAQSCGARWDSLNGMLYAPASANLSSFRQVGGMHLSECNRGLSFLLMHPSSSRTVAPKGGDPAAERALLARAAAAQGRRHAARRAVRREGRCQGGGRAVGR